MSEDMESPLGIESLEGISELMESPEGISEPEEGISEPEEGMSDPEEGMSEPEEGREEEPPLLPEVEEEREAGLGGAVQGA